MRMCEEMRETRAAIRAGCAMTGITQTDLAREMLIRPETLSRKMTGRQPFTEMELIVAERMVKYSAYRRETK